MGQGVFVYNVYAQIFRIQFHFNYFILLNIGFRIEFHRIPILIPYNEREPKEIWVDLAS